MSSKLSLLRKLSSMGGKAERLDEVVKSPADKKEYRAIRLSNNLKARNYFQSL